MANEITRLLNAWTSGNKEALNKLLPLVYSELHGVAEAKLLQERVGHTLQPTALINEVYLRLVNWQGIQWQSRAHFIAVTAQVMRNILVDHARKHTTEKRGGERVRISLTDLAIAAPEQDIDLLLLDEALVKLAVLDPQQSRIVELRYFGGLNIEEIAEVIAVSPTTVSREWKVARLWLMRELADSK